MTKPAKNTICLWYDGGAEDAAQFYAKTFPDSSVGAVHRAPGDFPSGKKGDVLTVEFTVMGIPCLGLNGGPAFKQPLTRPKLIVTGTRSSATAAKRVSAAGARTNGDCPGRSRRSL
jgi:predicted 3-demethylubiquinone-9 3-methyltransferase (glyoxalase superfamily)